MLRGETAISGWASGWSYAYSRLAAEDAERSDYLREAAKREMELLREVDTRPKLGEREVRELRERHARGESGASLAKRFGVSREAISQAVRRKTYRRVP